MLIQDGLVPPLHPEEASGLISGYSMLFQQAQLPIPGQTAGQAAGYSRSTSGCGAMGERSPARDAAEVCTRSKTEES